MFLWQHEVIRTHPAWQCPLMSWPILQNVKELLCFLLSECKTLLTCPGPEAYPVSALQLGGSAC